MAIKKPSRRFIKIVAITLIFIIGFTIFFFVRGIIIQNYCVEKAHKITGDKANILVESNEEEKKYYDLSQITLWFREELKCEKETKF